MIVITYKSSQIRCVQPGDKFQLTVTDNMGCEVLIRETITVEKVIDFIASYRFALDDGTCPGFHLCGVFANKGELPKELQNAVLYEDLTKEQQQNFKRTVGIKI